ncbi:Agamous-like MADS-box protein AGL86 [Arabidopsis thaliana]|uniref:AGL86 n=2 Tax=Arabidopsis TaxID=3701 RepID=A0A178W8T2_ARATH|nr:Transcription factor MADS-box [Arabidopsis thaliana x Arabidopsis arenosa]OAP14827.1 AGL86 [Arabidopsis thaliana]VYS47723.1 unnamed protein product [Arabidopsis thaliana]
MRSKIKLSLIANKTSRRTTFRKRKGGITNKLHELTTLCGVKACAVISSPYENPVVWPSTEGVQEAVSMFMERPATERSKLMMSQETYLKDKITKEQNKLESLRRENREAQLRRFMFDCVEGKMSEHQYGARDLQDLSLYIDHYINQLNSSVMLLTNNGASSSSFPPPLHTSVAGAGAAHLAVAGAGAAPLAVAGAGPLAVAGAGAGPLAVAGAGAGPLAVVGAGAAPLAVAGAGLPMDQNQYEPIQPYIPTAFSDNIQYQAPVDFNHQIQHGIYDNFSLDPNHQYPFQDDPFMEMLMEYPYEQVGYAGEHAHIPFMNGNHYNYHQPPPVGLTTTGHMPSNNATTTTTTTNTTDV